MPGKCTTKEAVAVLENSKVLNHTGHDVDPSARLVTAAIAMRRSEWWWQTPDTDRYRGLVSGLPITRYNRIHTNEFSGEINNATEL